MIIHTLAVSGQIIQTLAVGAVSGLIIQTLAIGAVSGQIIQTNDTRTVYTAWMEYLTLISHKLIQVVKAY